jgi:hypothetical protein
VTAPVPWARVPASESVPFLVMLNLAQHPSRGRGGS